MIAAWVPTGMKAGVRTVPWAVAISPVRAAPSVASGETESGHLRAPEQQAGIAIGIEPVAGFDRMRIGALHQVETAKRRDQHEQCRARQMEIGQQRVDGTEPIARRNEERGLAGKRRERAVFARGAFQQPQRRGAHCDDAPALAPGPR